MGTIRRHPRLISTLLVAIATLMGGASAHATVPIEQQPLFVGSGVPGNLLLVPSVEWPTIVTQANIGTFSRTRTYAGYFDSLKCYGYRHSLVEAERHFYPVSTVALDGNCAGKLWHGNYMNWAATQTIDPFRKGLTGGLRVRDTATETWLEKARHDRNQQYPNNQITNAVVAGAVSPFASIINTCVRNLGNRMRISAATNCASTVGAVPYDPAVHTSLLNASNETLSFDVTVRVKVCDAGVGVESNCKRYASGWKPEGLLQEYSEDIRYGIFGYLNETEMLRDGGVLRARMKFVGPDEYFPGRDPAANLAAEWDPVTGVLAQNPNPADATATGGGVVNSGVINYVNRFGQMTDAPHKGFDPVSEMYYAALRYLRNVGNVPAYSKISETGTDRYRIADGFPVITDWEDPFVARVGADVINMYCAKTALLGIGDVYTHRDKNLPGNKSTGDEPSTPPEVAADPWVDVVTAIDKIAQLENITIGTPFTGRQNSAYIAGLAYHANTTDLRPDIAGLQTASTYWVDVRENQTLERRARNQYWLATKYGGFTVPEGYDPYARTDPLPNEWWNSGELLSTGDPRPRNFYVASDAEQMVASLRRAFANIAQEVGGSGASFAANTTRLEVGARAYQAQFFSGSWHGDIKAFDINPTTGATSEFPVWSAASRLAATAAGTGWQTRRIFVNNGSVANNAAPPNFVHTGLSATQKGILTSAQVDFLRGSRAGEGVTLRLRSDLLGDIVHSEPVFVGAPNTNLYRSSAFSGAANYAAFASTEAARRKLIYAGANDGMLHGFDADTGDEVWAFVPSTAISTALRDFTLPGYVHQYTVDGEMTVADVYIAGAWRTVLIGTMGRGTPGVFALNITDPNNPRFMWEINQSNVPALGNNIGKPIIAQVANGQWRVLMGNGPNGAGSTAQLLQINVANGAVTVQNTGEAGSLGLSAVQAWDENGDGFTDTAYAGDFEGNLWKFTGLGGTVAQSKLFTAVLGSENQPITAAPLTARNPANGETWVFFGTGRYLSQGDLADDSVNTWYGLRDNGTAITNRSVLAERKIVAEAIVDGRAVRVIEAGEEDDFDLINNKLGWYIDLKSPVNGAEGERMVVPNRFQGLVLVGTTRIPDSTDVCNPSGRGFIMAIDPFTGGRLGNNFFDINADGLVNPGDSIDVGGVLTPVSGLGFNSSPNNPIFVGSVMLVTFDDGSSASVQTSQGGLGVRRASWRELIVP